MKFADIPGHEDIKQRLRAMADAGTIPHALLLEGPEGVGKYALARAFAQYIHCQNRTPDGDSCGECPACRQHESFNHIDTIFSFPVVKKSGGNGLSDDYLPDFRELMQESMFMDYESWLEKLDNINAQPRIYVDEANDLIRKLSLTAQGSRYMIVLMWLPEKLQENAANKLLKLIEEPFGDTLFILTSDRPRLILPTIYSRTQRIPVRRYDDAEVVDYLTRHCAIDAAAAGEIARLATGSIERALKLVSTSKESTLFLNLFMDLMRKAYSRKIAELKKWAEDVSKLGREREMNFYDYCARMIRENFILNLQQTHLTYLNAAEMQFSSRFSPFINERNVLQLFEVMNDARIDIAANANGKIVNFDVAIKVILLLKQ